MGKYFGTDGFRGEANVKLTADHAFRVGRYLGWYYGRDHKAKIVPARHRDAFVGGQNAGCQHLSGGAVVPAVL